MAKKKIYDIIPPRKKDEFFEREKERDARPRIKPKDIPKEEIKKGPKESRKSSIISVRNILAFCVLIIVAVVFYWFFSSAKKVWVDIWPKLDPFTINASVAFSTSTTDFKLAGQDLSALVIPAEFMEIQKTFTQQFSSSEVAVGDKAHGTIRVYNKYNRAISLVEGTRFLSSSEPTKQFHAQQKITIAPGGYVDVPVIASEPGESYNIEPSAFSIPGLRNSSPAQLYYDVFGKSFTKMEGGRKQNIFKISEDDFAKAQKELLENTRQNIKTVLQNEVGADYKILDKTINLQLLKGEAADAKVGQETPNFVYQIETKISATKIKSAFLYDFAKAYLRSTIPVTKGFTDQFLTIEILPRGDAKEAVLNLTITTRSYSQPDIESLKEVVKGHTRKEISRYIIEIYPEISKPLKIIFTPLWAHKASLGPEAIDIKLNF